MREIKFRALSFGTKISTGKKEWMYLDYLGAEWESLTDSESIGEFTGLLDRNGKEIYEGDIIEVQSTFKDRTVVRWNENAARFEMGGSYKVDMPHVLIIGNIYENPDLLPKK